MAMVTVVEGGPNMQEGKGCNPANLSQEVDVKDSGLVGLHLYKEGAEEVMNKVVK